MCGWEWDGRVFEIFANINLFLALPTHFSLYKISTYILPLGLHNLTSYIYKVMKIINNIVSSWVILMLPFGIFTGLMYLLTLFRFVRRKLKR